MFDFMCHMIGCSDSSGKHRQRGGTAFAHPLACASLMSRYTPSSNTSFPDIFFPKNSKIALPHPNSQALIDLRYSDRVRSSEAIIINHETKISFLPFSETQPQLMLTGPMAMGGGAPGMNNSFGAAPGGGMPAPGSNYQGYSM